MGSEVDGMTWNRYGSEFTRDRRWDGVPYEARWHYFAIVAECSDSERYDCRLPLRIALRASDVDDPMAASEALVAAGFARIEGHDFLIVDGEQKHMPPPHMRDPERKRSQRDRKARQRQTKCDAGQHDRHCPSTCPQRDPGHGVGHAGPNVSSGAVHEESTSIEFAAHERSDEGHSVGHAGPQNRTEQNRTLLGGSVRSDEPEQGSDLDLAAFAADLAGRGTVDV